MEKITIKTKVITGQDDIVQVAAKALEKEARDGDVIVISSKVVSISQGMVKPFDELKISRLARFLSKFVTKPLSGEGLGRVDKEVEIAIIDANDYGDVDVWGKTAGLDPEFVENSCADNFLGQRLEQTPIGIIRP